MGRRSGLGCGFQERPEGFAYTFFVASAIAVARNTLEKRLDIEISPATVRGYHDLLGGSVDADDLAALSETICSLHQAAAKAGIQGDLAASLAYYEQMPISTDRVAYHLERPRGSTRHPPKGITYIRMAKLSLARSHR